MSNREIKIHDAREDTRDDHELEVTRGNQSTAMGFTTPELCRLYVAIEERLRQTGMSRPRIVRTGEMQARR